jgi:excisionase family DNA binding protein
LPECWRVARVARVLDVSRKRVYQLIRERRLEVVRVGPRQIRVLRASLDDFLARLRREEADRDY